jgi:hypothetical protein
MTAPQINVHAYAIDRGRVWVETIDAAKKTALIRFDANLGRRSRVHEIRLADIDFSREWKF